MTDVSKQCLDRAQACDLDCQTDTADVLRQAAAEIDRLREDRDSHQREAIRAMEAANRLRERATAIADDYHPSHERETALALAEMRDAIGALAH